MTTADKLDSLSDADLNTAFALAYGGWRKAPLQRGDKAHRIVARYEHEQIKRPGSQTYFPTVVVYNDGLAGGDLWPVYSTDLNAVIPFLDLQRNWDINDTSVSIHRHRRGWSVSLNAPSWDDVGVSAEASTLARAAVIALLRAHQTGFTP